MHRALHEHLVDNNVTSPLSTVFLVLLSTHSLNVFCCSMMVNLVSYLLMHQGTLFLGWMLPTLLSVGCYLIMNEHFVGLGINQVLSLKSHKSRQLKPGIRQ